MLATVPGVTVYAPASFRELQLHLRQALYDTDGIAAVRYPKGGEHPMLEGYEPSYEPYEHTDGRTRELLVVTYGRTYGEVLSALRQRSQNGRRTSVLKLNRILPPVEAAVTLAATYRCVLFVEEGVVQGGIGEMFGYRLAKRGYTGRYAVRGITENPGVCTTAEGLHDAGLDAEGIAAFIREYDKPEEPHEG